MLHGYTQNADVFKKRTAILRKDLQSVAELGIISCIVYNSMFFNLIVKILLVYVSAPLFVPFTEDQAKTDAALYRSFINSLYFI